MSDLDLPLNGASVGGSTVLSYARASRPENYVTNSANGSIRATTALNFTYEFSCCSVLFDIHPYLLDPSGELVAVFAVLFAHGGAFVDADIGQVVG